MVYGDFFLSAGRTGIFNAQEGQAMSVTCTGEDRNLRLAVSGEVDHHGARAIMQELDQIGRAHV